MQEEHAILHLDPRLVAQHVHVELLARGVRQLFVMLLHRFVEPLHIQ